MLRVRSSQCGHANQHLSSYCVSAASCSDTQSSIFPNSSCPSPKRATRFIKFPAAPRVRITSARHAFKQLLSSFVSAALNTDTHSSGFSHTACPSPGRATRLFKLPAAPRVRSTQYGHASERFFPYFVSIAGASDTFF